MTDFVDFDRVSRDEILSQYDIVRYDRPKKGDLFMTSAWTGGTHGVSLKRDNKKSLILPILQKKV